MENGDPGIFQPLQVSRLETGWIGSPGGKLLEIQREQAQHIDHSGFADQVQSAGGIFHFALSEERKPAPIEQRRA
jgi:hypothetical protein